MIVICFFRVSHCPDHQEESTVLQRCIQRRNDNDRIFLDIGHEGGKNGEHYAPQKEVGTLPEDKRHPAGWRPPGIPTLQEAVEDYIVAEGEGAEEESPLPGAEGVEPDPGPEEVGIGGGVEESQDEPGDGGGHAADDADNAGEDGQRQILAHDDPNAVVGCGGRGRGGLWRAPWRLVGGDDGVEGDVFHCYGGGGEELV